MIYWRADWGDLVMARQKIELAADEAEELSRRARATTVSVRDRRRAEIIVLSAETCENVWAYTTIPTVREILLIRSTHIAAELIRRQPDGSWPATSISLGEDDWLPLESIDFGCALTTVYEGTRFHRTGEN